MSKRPKRSSMANFLESLNRKETSSVMNTRSRTKDDFDDELCAYRSSAQKEYNEIVSKIKESDTVSLSISKLFSFHKWFSIFSFRCNSGNCIDTNSRLCPGSPVVCCHLLQLLFHRKVLLVQHLSFWANNDLDSLHRIFRFRCSWKIRLMKKSNLPEGHAWTAKRWSRFEFFLLIFLSFLKIFRCQPFRTEKTCKCFFPFVSLAASHFSSIDLLKD